MTVAADRPIAGEPPDGPGVHPLALTALPVVASSFPSPSLTGERSRFAALRDTTWFPVAMRALGIGALIAALGSVGAISVAFGLPDANELPGEMAAAGLSLPWLASPRPPATAEAPRAAAPAHPALRPSAELSRPPVPQVVPVLAGDGVVRLDSRRVALPPGEGAAAPAAASSAGAAEAAPALPGLMPDGKVILNTANAAELMRLPGVGAKRADAIVVLRTRLGRFRRASDLLRVRGIGPSTLQRMQPHFVLDPPPEAPSEP